ncbi:hypothetical protein F5141DRAFT_1149079 [Pisolithus sp. B1]|nr:hypothetical protein F5141DRAFT_1149079 [Pisolithus sp. B1]
MRFVYPFLLPLVCLCTWKSSLYAKRRDLLITVASRSPTGKLSEGATETSIGVPGSSEVLVCMISHLLPRALLGFHPPPLHVTSKPMETVQKEEQARTEERQTLRKSAAEPKLCRHITGFPRPVLEYSWE